VGTGERSQCDKLEEKFELDVWYVDNQSVWLDLKILWLTLVKVFKGKGSRRTSMPRWKNSKETETMTDRFTKWKRPTIIDGKPTKYLWIVKHKDKFCLGDRTDIGAFTYINAKNGVTIEDDVQIGSHCSIYSISTIDGRKARSS